MQSCVQPNTNFTHAPARPPRRCSYPTGLDDALFRANCQVTGQSSRDGTHTAARASRLSAVAILWGGIGASGATGAWRAATGKRPVVVWSLVGVGSLSRSTAATTDDDLGPHGRRTLAARDRGRLRAYDWRIHDSKCEDWQNCHTFFLQHRLTASLFSLLCLKNTTPSVFYLSMLNSKINQEQYLSRL